MSWIHDKAKTELERVNLARKKQVYPYFRPFETGGLHTTIGGKPIVNFSSNDYLGLTNHPKVKEAAIKAVEKYACGLSSSRVQATTVEHVELERRLASARVHVRQERQQGLPEVVDVREYDRLLVLTELRPRQLFDKFLESTDPAG